MADGVRQTHPDAVVQSVTGVARTVLDEPVGSPFIWWPMDEGSGSTANDVLGTHDGTIRGATWVGDSTAMGGAKLDGDGTDDWVETDPWGSFGSNLTSDLAIAYTATIASGDSGYHVGNDETGDGGPGLFVGTRDFINDNAGELGITIYDDGASNNIGISSDNSFDDGTRRRVLWNKTSNSATGLELHIDGSAASYSTFSSGTLSSTSDFSKNIGLLSQQSGSNPTDSVIDDVVVYQTSLSSSEITDDYQRQNWS